MNDFQEILKTLLEMDATDPTDPVATGESAAATVSIEDAKNPFEALMAFKKEHEALIGGLRTQVSSIAQELQGALATATTQKQTAQTMGIGSQGAIDTLDKARQGELQKSQTARDALRARVAALRNQNVPPTGGA